MADVNWTGRLSSFFLNNGKLTLTLVIALFVWGGLSFWVTPKKYNPKITAPAFKIHVQFPGADRVEVLEQVTKPLENTIAQIPDVEDIFSVTRHGGSVQVIANFYVGSDFEEAKITLSDKLRSNLNLAPLGIAEPVVQSIDPEDVPVFVVALSSDEINPVELRKFAFRLRDRMMNLQGASAVDVVGGRRKELSILVNPDRLTATNADMQDIERALRNNNRFAPVGVIKSSENYRPVEAQGTVTNPEQLKNLIVLSNDIIDVRLKEVAAVRDGMREVVRYVTHTKKEDTKKYTVLLSFAKLDGYNISDLTHNIEKRLSELRTGFIPKSIHAETVSNLGYTADKEIGQLVVNLITAIIIVVVILLLFLDTRAAFLVAVSIPLTLLTVFGISEIAGQTINRITLFALILSLGLLVDNATVVTENIVRHIRSRAGESKRKIIIGAVGEVGPGLFMSTVTTVLAFVPMAFVTGMMGPYMGPIPFFVPAALIVSLILSFTVTPWLAALLLKQQAAALPSRGPVGRFIDKLTRPAQKFLASAGDALQSFVRRIMHTLLHNKGPRVVFLSAIVILLLGAVMLPATALVKFRMLPKDDKEKFFLYIDLPTHSALKQTRDVARAVESFLLKEPHVTQVQSYIGRAPILDFNGLFRGTYNRQEPHMATLRVGLTEPDRRDIKSERIVYELRPKLEAFARALPFNKNQPTPWPGGAVKLKLVEDPPGPPVLSTMLVRVQSQDPSAFAPAVNGVVGLLQGIDGVVDLDTSIPRRFETVQLKIDQNRATQRRITTVQIIDALQTAYTGKIVGLYHNKKNIEQEYITLRMDRKFRKDDSSLAKLTVKNTLGIAIPLIQVAEFQKVPAAHPLWREGRKETAYVYGDMAKRSVTYSAIDLLLALDDFEPVPGAKLESMDLFGAVYSLPSGESMQITIGGEWELTLEVFRDLGLAMGVAVLLIYIALVAQFSSFMEPLIILSTIPLSVLGVFPGFFILYHINGINFNATSMIGVIALAGIAVNNSIILLEYLNDLKRKGLPLEEALLDAGLTRFRPIMLTTVTTILGSLTIAGDPVWAGLAWAIIWGLGVSSILTVLVFPVLYLMIKGHKWPGKAAAPAAA